MSWEDEAEAALQREILKALEETATCACCGADVKGDDLLCLDCWLTRDEVSANE